jgi:hypothetical protein
VNVHTHIELGRNRGGFRERLVGAGERGVHAHHSFASGSEKSAILIKPQACSRRTVAVRHPIRTDHSHTDLGTCLGNDIEGTIDRTRRLVVINDGRRPTGKCLKCAKARRVPDDVEIKRPIETPPHHVQNLEK